LRVVPALLAVALLAFVLRSVDLGRVFGLVHALGWLLPLLLLPNLAVTLIEAVAWRRSFGLLGVRPRLPGLVRVRLAAEALMLGLPSGAVVSESLQPYLLMRRCDVPFETAVVASVGRKFFVVVSHGVVLAAVTLLSWPLVAAASRATIGRGGLPWLLLGSAVFMIATFGVGIAASARSRVAERLRSLLGRLGGRWLGPWLDRHATGFQRADEQLVRFFERRRSGLILPLALYVGGWLVRALETLLYLRLLGIGISFTTATLVESALVLVRSVAVPIPAGLGVQDVGYVLTFRALGVPDATTIGAAFVLLKRAKDLFWILVGFALLGVSERAPPVQSAAPGAQPAS
jgi:uncharacterized protein (TIRG00374 family)